MARAPSAWTEAALSLLRMRHGWGSKVRWTLAVLSYQFIVDDMGKEHLPYCGAAGYLATEAQWTAWMPAWEAALPPDMRGGNFSFAALVRQIGGGRDAADARRLIAVLSAHMSFGFSRLVHMESWNALAPKYKRLWGHPYSLCLVLLLDDVLDELKRFEGMDEAERLVTVAEYMDPYDPARPPARGDRTRRKLERRTGRLWDFWRDLRGMQDRVKVLDFDDRQRAPQLQAADVYAHASYRVRSRPHYPLRFVGLPDVSSSPPFPPALYRTMVNFLRGPTPRHAEYTIMDSDLERCAPTFDLLIERMEEDPNDPLARYFKLDPDDDDEGT